MTAELPLILLPPSEGKAAGGSGPAWAPSTMRYDLDDQRTRTLRALAQTAKWSTPRRAALLGVKGPSLEAATAANRDVADSPTMPAIELPKPPRLRDFAIPPPALPPSAPLMSWMARLTMSMLPPNGK